MHYSSLEPRMSLSVDAAGKANKVKTSATTSSATTAVSETFAATTAGTTLPASVAGLDLHSIAV